LKILNYRFPDETVKKSNLSCQKKYLTANNHRYFLMSTLILASRQQQTVVGYNVCDVIHLEGFGSK